MEKIPLSQRISEAGATDLVMKFSRIYTDDYFAALEQSCGGKGYVDFYTEELLSILNFYPDTRLGEAAELLTEGPEGFRDSWLYRLLIEPFTTCYFGRL